MQNNIINRSGFTLIELLVVVLIIGILAAVALPKYQVAVIKSRIIPYVLVGKSIMNAQEVRYMDTGSYEVDLRNLDVDLGGCQVSDANWGNAWKCGHDVYMDLSAIDHNTLRGVLMVEYCPGNNADWSSCGSTRDFMIQMNLEHASSHGYYYGTAGSRICEVKNNSRIGEKVCKALLGGGWVDMVKSS